MRKLFLMLFLCHVSMASWEGYSECDLGTMVCEKMLVYKDASLEWEIVTKQLENEVYSLMKSRGLDNNERFEFATRLVLADSAKLSFVNESINILPETVSAQLEVTSKNLESLTEKQEEMLTHKNEVVFSLNPVSTAIVEGAERPDSIRLVDRRSVRVGGYSGRLRDALNRLGFLYVLDTYLNSSFDIYKMNYRICSKGVLRGYGLTHPLGWEGVLGKHVREDLVEDELPVIGMIIRNEDVVSFLMGDVPYASTVRLSRREMQGIASNAKRMGVEAGGFLVIDGIRPIKAVELGDSGINALVGLLPDIKVDRFLALSSFFLRKVDGVRAIDILDSMSKTELAAEVSRLSVMLDGEVNAKELEECAYTYIAKRLVRILMQDVEQVIRKGEAWEVDYSMYVYF